MKIFVSAFIIFISTMFSQKTSYGDAFLNIRVSSRSVGLGRSVVALPQNADGYLQRGIGLTFNNLQVPLGFYYSFSNHDLGNAPRIGGWKSL